MRILRVIAGVDPSQGGPVEGLRRSAALHVAWGHETEVVSLDPPDSPQVRDFPLPVHGIGPVPRKYGYTPRLGRWIAQNARRFDAAVVHGIWNHASVGGGQALSRAGLPYALFSHGMLDPWFRKTYPLKHAAKQVFWWAGQGAVLRRAGKVLFTSQEEQILAQGAFLGPGWDGQVVPYGAAEPGAQDRAAGPAEFAARLPGLGDAPYLLFLSRIHRKKGCDLLIEAFVGIAARRPDLHLVVAGPDQSGLAADLRARAGQLGFGARVHFPGLLTGAAKWGAYLGAEAFVLPSHQENFGIVVAEALACGVPVLTTDKVNIWREVAGADAGLIASDTGPGIDRLLQDWAGLPAPRKRQMAENARACFEAHFRLETAAQGLLDVLTGLRRAT